MEFKLRVLLLVVARKLALLSSNMLFVESFMSCSFHVYFKFFYLFIFFRLGLLFQRLLASHSSQIGILERLENRSELLILLA